MFNDTLLMIILQLLDFIVLLVPVLISVAILTLLERKVMGSIQRRRGPNVVGLFGILQPFADGIKLIGKQFIIPSNAHKVLFVAGPIFSFSISLILWSLVPFSPFPGGAVGRELFLYDDSYSLLFLLAISSLGVYGIVISGWASNSMYAFLGCLRAAAQMISYEVVLGLTILPVVILAQSYNMREIVFSQYIFWNIIPIAPAAAAFFITSLAETNRTPFDLPEAEGELVAGFNVEYAAIFFALFFLAEYSNIVLMSTLFTILFLGGWTPLSILSPLFFATKVALVLFAFIWIRAILPRYRYDQLIQIGWVALLPFTMGYFLFVAGTAYVFV